MKLDTIKTGQTVYYHKNKEERYYVIGAFEPETILYSNYNKSNLIVALVKVDKAFHKALTRKDFVLLSLDYLTFYSNKNMDLVRVWLTKSLLQNGVFSDIIPLEEAKEYLQDMHSYTRINSDRLMECRKLYSKLPVVKVENRKIGQFYLSEGKLGIVCSVILRSAYTKKEKLFSVYLDNKQTVFKVLSDIGFIIGHLDTEGIKDKTLYDTGLNVMDITILRDQIKYESSICV